MRRSYPSRLTGAFVALFSMLFMQLAIAGYVCPSYSAVNGDPVASMAMSDDAGSMIQCNTMDDVQPNLCHAFAHTNDQSLDKPDLPNVQPFVPSVLTLVFLTVEHPDGVAITRPDSAVALHVPLPPLSITNCCFRI